MEDLSILVREKRIKKGISQRELARRINVDGATILRIEIGQIKKPSIILSLKLCRELDIDVVSFLEKCGYSFYDVLKLYGLFNYAINSVNDFLTPVVGTNNEK